MRVLISVVKEVSADPSAYWRVEVEGTQVHHLRRLHNGFPFPTDEAALDAITELSALWQGTSREQGLLKAFADIHGGNPSSASLLGFGRYLLETLLGHTLWQQLEARCPAGESLELVLQWDAGEWELNRLYWELMRDATGFLAEQQGPEVSMVRQVPIAGAARPRARIDLRVLFVVGTDLSDPQIRSGAEYLGLLRHLSTQHRALNHRILLAANGEELAEAVRAYQPTVLHLTCHGEWGSVRLKPGREAPPSEERDGFKRWSAQDLFQLLQDTGAPLPTVVVVNACDSASGRPVTPQESAAGKAPPPAFAVELAQLGIPLVVGMAGRIADHACRLFTRRLYESLLDSTARTPVDLGLATAKGRRAGLQFLNGRYATSDWAFPRLIIRGDTDARLELGDVQEATTRERVANKFRVHHPFCDRLESFRAFERWLDSGHCEQSHFVIVGPEREREPVKYGATRLMNELAVHAIYSGYIPILLSFPDGSTEAPSATTLLKELRNKMNAARGDWGLQPAQGSEIRNLLLRANNPTQPLHPELAAELAVSELTDPNVLRLALAIDLASLVKDTRTDQDPHGKKALLLLDGIHTWSPGLTTLLRMLEERLVFEGITIPVVVSCRRWPDNAQVDQLLRTFLERRTVEPHRIGRFPETIEALAYSQYTLLRQPPQVPNPDNPKAAALLERFFKKFVGGVPSRLHENQQLNDVLEILSSEEVLLSADDQAAMRALLQAAPPPSAGVGT